MKSHNIWGNTNKRYGWKTWKALSLCDMSNSTLIDLVFQVANHNSAPSVTTLIHIMYSSQSAIIAHIIARLLGRAGIIRTVNAFDSWLDRSTVICTCSRSLIWSTEGNPSMLMYPHPYTWFGTDYALPRLLSFIESHGHKRLFPPSRIGANTYRIRDVLPCS